jgi:hypothetical protein
MNTAQTLLSKGAQTKTVTSITPWIVGGVVVVAVAIAALFIMQRK